MRDRKSISVLRVCAMILILACHIVQEHDNIYINMTAKFLNVGVSIFIIILGYLYVKKEIKEGGKHKCLKKYLEEMYLL